MRPLTWCGLGRRHCLQYDLAITAKSRRIVQCLHGQVRGGAAEFKVSKNVRAIVLFEDRGMHIPCAIRSFRNAGAGVQKHGVAATSAESGLEYT
jgi:hypothetical protein